MQNASGERGFTLVELMIVIVLLAIVATIAVPNFTQFIRNNQVQAKADEVERFLQSARAQAVTSRKRYEVTTGATWEVKPVGGTVERKLEFNTAQARARVSTGTLTFEPNGTAASAAQITVCRDTDAENGYFIEIKRSGMVRMHQRGVDVPSDCQI